MSQRCVVFGCTSNTKKNKQLEYIHTYRFPKSETLKEKWKYAINKPSEWMPSKHSVVCAKHFLSSDFIVKDSKNPKLKKNAIPSIIPFETHCAIESIEDNDATNLVNNNKSYLKIDSIDITTLNLVQVCRCCMEYKTEYIDIILGKYDVKLKKYTNICVERGEGLPEIICYNCVNNLITTDEFIQKCEKSEETLRKLLEDCSQKNDSFEQNNDNIELSKTTSEITNDHTNEIITLVSDNTESDSDEYFSQESNTESLNNLIIKVDETHNADFGEKQEEESSSDRNSIQNEQEFELDCRNDDFVMDTGYNSEILHENKLFSCQYCGKEFNETYTLKLHINEIHPELADNYSRKLSSYHCEICNKTFKFKKPYNINIHKSTHSNIRPYECPETGCGKTFTHEQLLKKHIRNKTYKKPNLFKSNPRTYKEKVQKKQIKVSFICEWCGKMFATYTSYKQHTSFHTTTEKDKIKCKFCEKKFVRKADAIVHEQSHNTEKSYICEICNKSFVIISSLRAHKKTHEMRERFPCVCCNKTFKCLKYLKNHYRNMAKPPTQTKKKKEIE